MRFICCQKRWILAFLACTGYMIILGIRCNIGAAKVISNGTNWVDEEFGIQNASNATSKFDSLQNINTTVELSPLQAWDVKIMSLVVSSTFYGSLVLQLPGGLIANKYSAKKLFGIAVGGMSLLNICMPVACLWHYSVVVLIQFVQGLLFGLTYPMMGHLWKHWAPPSERTKLVTTGSSGGYIGVVVGMPLSAILVSHVNWQAPFYAYGGIGLIWLIFWWTLAHDKPSMDTSISTEELYYIEESLGDKQALDAPSKITDLTWKAIVGSKPVWAIICANFCRNWTFYVYIIFSLSYMQNVLGMDVETGGYWASAPYVVMTITMISGGQTADYIISKKYLSRTRVRKLFNTIGFGGESIFLLACAFVTNKYIAVPCLILSAGISGFSLSGFGVNPLDIAPKYAGLLVGITNGLANISGLICPILIEYLTETYHLKGWRISYIMCACIHITGILIYLTWGTAELQKWATTTTNPKLRKATIQSLEENSKIVYRF